ncbi:phospholipid carrier-dependent glycosyltransferase [Petrachloros mirabilis]
MPALVYLGSVISALIIATGILYSFALLGRAVQSVWPNTGWSSAVTVLWNVFIGIGIGAVVTSVSGMLGFFNLFLFLGVLAAGPLLCAMNPDAFIEPWRAIRDAVHSLREQPVLTLPLLVAAAVVTGPSAAPEIFYDALNYHLGLQWQYLIAGEIQWITTVVHSAFPAHLDVLFGLCMRLGGPAAAKFFNLMLFLLGWCATAVFILEVLGDRRAALAGAVTVGTIPGVMVMSTMSGIDAALIGFAAMSGLALARMRSAGTEDLNRLACLAAVGAGVAAGSKYTGLWLVGVFPLVILVILDPRRAVRPVLLFVGMSMLIASPWYVRNVMATGDPVYPVLSAHLGNEDAQWAVERIKRDVPATGLSFASLNDLVVGLVNNPGRFGAGAEPGLLIPLGVGLLFTGALWIPLLRPWALAVAVYGVLWLSQSSVLRYLYPIFPFCALGVAWAASALFDRIRRPTLVMAMIALLALVPMLQSVRILDALYGAQDIAALFSGTVSKDEYLTRRLAYYPAAQWLNNHASSDSHVYYLGETRLLYLDRPVTMSSAYDHNEIADLLAPNSPPLLAQLKDRGVTHIMIHGREIERLRGSYDYLPISTDAEHQLRVSLAGCRIVFAKSGVQVCELP